VLAWDDNPLLREAASREGINVVNLADWDWSLVKALVLSPGIPHIFPAPHPLVQQAKEAGIPIISDIEVFAKTHPQASLIGITGTNGKSTTTALISHILNEAHKLVQVGGNIGVGVLALEPLPSQGFYVLEMSSYQLELTPSINFDAAVLLNLTPDHIVRHGSFEGYIAAKEKIFNNQRPGQVAVIGRDDPETERIYHQQVARQQQRVIGISAFKPVEGGVFIEDHYLIDATQQQSRKILDLRQTAFLNGMQNRQNIAAAYAVCCHIGLMQTDILKGLKTFQGLAHRQEIIAVIDHVTYINDSKATNAASVALALNNYENIFWIVGGRPKSEGLNGLSRFYSKIKQAFVIGEALEDFSSTLNPYVRVTKSVHLEQAVHDAHKAASLSQTSCPIVLLSPACESFDQFKNFEDRGDCFKEYVKKLPGLRGAIDQPPFLALKSKVL
ncbi:MAG: UDP-N-acetylmuramoyl-L-alanine--D-glutamate ligase, partial [Alphaproteobacteria bacterium]|nr:UDP-N-acetylmuramoyl-L-alanine--D-glutamate ligase [Alphaproteobacteria bacterium]